MRKYIIMALVLTCLSTGGILWAYIDINGQQDDITIKETIEAGKQSATKGIKVTAKVLDSQFRLNWNTDMYLDGSGKIKSQTDFIYDRNGEIRFHDIAEDRYQVTERFQYRTSHFSQDAIQNEKDEMLDTGIPAEMLKTAYDASGDKERFTWQGYLDDYTDYLPVDLYTDCPDSDHTMLDTDQDLESQFNSWSSYFQLPVPKDYPYQIEINKNGFEDLIEIRMTATEADESYCTANSDGFWDGATLYLAISGMEESSSGDIFAECPDEKRGIHVFPTKTEPYPYLEFDQAEMVYPIPSGTKVINLTQSQDGKTLYLLTKKQEQLTVDIIDKKTYTCRQQLGLSKTSEYTSDFELSMVGEDWILYSLGRGEFVLLAENQGAYEEVMENCVGGLFLEGYEDCAYDGERLAVVTIDRDSVVVETTLFVFDKRGCLYRGCFDYDIARSSFTDDDSSYHYQKRVDIEFIDDEI